MRAFLLRSTAFIGCGSALQLEKPGRMSSKDRRHRKEDAADPEDLDSILDSPACRRLFDWGRSKDAIFSSDEGTQKQKEEERLRWNFDFETETPLPGRYQWYRSNKSNGHSKNGAGSQSGVDTKDVVEQRLTRSKATAPYTRKSQSQDDGSSVSLPQSEPRRSERRSQQLKKTHCRFKWD